MKFVYGSMIHGKAEQTNDFRFFFQVEILIVSSVIKRDEK